MAAPTLTVSPVTWNIIGLDPTPPLTTGPDTFPVGARVCNTSAEDATNVVATFQWTSANAYVALADAGPITRGTIAAGTCGDYYFQVVVTRNSAAFFTARRFVISAIADGMTDPVSTPTPREVYVEKLVSQNRNSVDGLDIAGACTAAGCTVYVGQTYTITLNASTATQYEQLSAYVNLPSAIFQVESITQTYTHGASTSTIYADACAWRNDPTATGYRSCSATGKAGGTIVGTYVVKVVGAGSGRLSSLIYDFSGSSYHYNADFGDALTSRVFTAVVPSENDEENDEEEQEEDEEENDEEENDEEEEQEENDEEEEQEEEQEENDEEEEQEENDEEEEQEDEETDEDVVNEPPLARDDSAVTPYRTSVRLRVRANDEDPEDDDIAITTYGPALGGSVLCATTCLYRPRQGFVGTDSFRYTICDPHDGCDTGVAKVRVRRPTAPPIARDEEVTSDGGPVYIRVITNDEDPYGDELSLTDSDEAEFGTAACEADGLCLYSPQGGFSGVDSFDYQVCTELKSCARATAYVEVLGSRLARTGADPLTLARLALMLVLAGGAILAGARRRPAPVRSPARTR